jgi:uncharacterized membrane protein YciS (DUF1049 family)
MGLSVNKIRFYVLLVLFVLLLFILAVLGGANEALVTVNLFFFAPELRLSTRMAALLFLGFLFGVLTSLYTLAKIKLKKTLSQRKKSKSRLAKKPQDIGTPASTSSQSE